MPYLLRGEEGCLLELGSGVEVHPELSIRAGSDLYGLRGIVELIERTDSIITITTRVFF